MRTLRFDGETDDEFRNRAERAGQIARLLVEGCLRNRDVRELIADPILPYTEEPLRRWPIVRIEYEQAFAVGTIGECLDATKHKHWGDGPWILPLEPDDPVSAERILYVYKPESLYNRRFEQRRRLKELLGKKHRPLVGKAMRMRKKDYLAGLTTDDVRAVRERIKVEPGDLWRAARGKLFLVLPPRIVQLEFDFGD
ncbi:MAG TPA: hypothetical protein VMV10_19025 [Pirellulales bacterium]|nr:hypothetical protein [Pirellulales bacterium]